MRPPITLHFLRNTAAGRKPENEGIFSEVKEKKRKYNNQKIELDGRKFDSKKEARRYVELRALQTIGEITNLECQVTFQLSVCKYISDFQYYRNGERVVEDVKSPMTRRLSTYRLKYKLMQSELNIEIKEV